LKGERLNANPSTIYWPSK